MASKGPRSRKEALQMVAADVAAWMSGELTDAGLHSRTGFTHVQRERYDEAWQEVTRRVSAIGQPRRKEGGS